MVHGSRLEPQTANRRLWLTAMQKRFVDCPRSLINTICCASPKSRRFVVPPLPPPTLPTVSSSFSFSFSVCQNNFPFQIWHDHLEWACLDWLPRLSALMNFRVCLLISWAHYFHSALCQDREPKNNICLGHINMLIVILELSLFKIIALHDWSLLVPTR